MGTAAAQRFRRAVVAAAIAAVFVDARPAAAQRGGEDARVSPAEVQRMFDAYALMQAQEQLAIGDDQFSSFLTRYKALQDARRRGLQEHTRTVLELRQILMSPQPDPTVLKDRLKGLKEADARNAAEAQKALDAVDQVLDVRQQAKFRVFEELMERRKLELVSRAREARRPKDQR